MNDGSDTNTIFDGPSINDSENSKSCEAAPSSDVHGNEVEMCNGRLKCNFIIKKVINLSMRNITENEISLLSKDPDFISTYSRCS